MNERTNLVDAFERLWTNGSSPDLEFFLSGVGAIDADLISRLARIDQAVRWERGDRHATEEYLNRFPALRANGDSAVDLIFHEYLLRETSGERPALEEFTKRFPQHAASIVEQVNFHLALGPAPPRYDRMALDASQIADSLEINKHIDRDFDAGAARSSLGAMPRRLGRYELLSAVGAGTFGAVYKALDPELDRVVAIKIPRHGNVAGKDDVERFLREARSVARLRHPSIVSVHEIGQSGKTPYLVTEFIEGSTLADLLSAERPAPRQAAALVATLCEALHYAHEMGVVHRDVKPANIMLDEKGAPRLMDFGLARRDSGDATMTIEGQVLGTPGYMSPEQARGESRNVDGRSDIYSLGAVLYQLLAGQLPFCGTTEMLLHQLLHDEPKRPRAINKAIPRDLETICLKAMAKEPGGRYASARDMADDLRRFLQGEPIHARPIGGAERLWRWCRRKPALAGMTAAASILLLAVAVGGTLAAIKFGRQAEVAKEELYFNSIGFAHRELTASRPNPGRAEDLLNACPPERRNWEWDYLKGWRNEPLVLRAENNCDFRGVAFSHDGSRLAAACKDGKVRVWNLKTHEVVILPGHDTFVYSVAFSPVDSNRLASSGNDGWVRVWDVKLKRAALQPLPGLTVYPVGMAHCVTFSPDGKLLAAASEGGAARVWDAFTGTLRCELAGHEMWPGSLVFSRDGRLLATGDWVGKVRIWDPKSGEALKILQLPEHRWPVACLAFSPDSAGRYLAAGYFDNRVDVWDVWNATDETNPRRLRGHTGFVTSVAFHPTDARRLMSAGDDRDVRIWDVPTGREVLQLQGHIDTCSGVAFRPDGRQLASASYDGTIRLWDATPRDNNQRQELYTFDVPQEVWSVGISPDGKRVAAGCFGGGLRLWDASTGSNLWAFSDKLAGTVFSLAFSPDGQRIAATGADDDAFVLKVLDTLTGETVLEHRDRREIFATEFSPDGKWLALGMGDGSVELVAAKTAKEVIFVGKHDDQIAFGCIRFRPRDGLRLATASLDGTVRVWDLNSALSGMRRKGESDASSHADHLVCRISSSDPGTALWSVAYSPDGHRLLTGDKDGQLKQWDAETGEELNAELDNRSAASRGAFLSVAYSPNGRWIVSASEDCTARAYDAQTFELVHQFRGHLGPIRCLAISDELLVTAGTDRTVKVWDLKQFKAYPKPIISNQARFQ